MNILNLPNANSIGENDFFYVIQNGLDTKASLKQLPEATINYKGLMSKEDKYKLSSIPQDAFSLNYYGTPSEPVNGLKINTNITVDQYGALRLEIEYGFCQNQLSNEQISINIRFWDYNFIEYHINKIGANRHIGSIVAFLESNKLAFFINFINKPNVAGGLIGLRVMGGGNINAITNQVKSLEWSNSNYIPGTNLKECVMDIPASNNLLTFKSNPIEPQTTNIQPLTPPPPANSMPDDSKSDSYIEEFANTEILDNTKYSVDLDRLTKAVEHLCTKYTEDEILKQILCPEVNQS